MADNQSIIPMDWIGKNVEIKKGHNGVGNVTDPQMNAIIELAHGIWKNMGLSNEQIAAAIATMNIESGFNPLAEHTQNGKTYIGLGQFDEKTWNYAIDLYKKNYGEKLNPDLERYDILSQIKVMGSYMKYPVWPNAVYYNANPSLSGNSLQEIAYGLWNRGASRTTYKVDMLKTFLEGTKNGQFMNETGGLSGSFNDTYNNIYDELQLRNEANKNSDNAAPQAQMDEANKNLWDTVIEELKKFLDSSGTQDIIRQFIDQQALGSYPADNNVAWMAEAAETGENPDESLET